ncbi:exodeoxyribonuclease III [Cohaesibacter sp. CAU 1516]|uniref:exodeoxyribonuclease III n=1 Tax=Cohaesibacter sp. CAU 1516 TaxID=2576038 RepID=UPI0010FDFFC3|nr:exodeoxyribonuclease III [Cohaesibacter sp. CAU 1516]TLP46959.1 exodeoxyribonuclease III [Cohaesibacter sp. CAU 1516]
MPVTIASWNINSIRPRLHHVEQFDADRAPDVLCLQETKVMNDQFPSAALTKLGYQHLAINGQKSYHGVAILSRLPFASVSQRDFCGKGDARHIEVTIDTDAGPIRIHNFYVPAGGDEPNPAINDKFQHKLNFLDEMKAWLTGEETAAASILVGDLNIAPHENDVWSHKQLIKVVSHTPVEVDALAAVQTAGPWQDVVRNHIPVEHKLFSWWSYRSPNWQKSNKGRRLDHIWATNAIADKVNHVEVYHPARSWEKPSDHAPVIARLDVSPL